MASDKRITTGRYRRAYVPMLLASTMLAAGAPALAQDQNQDKKSSSGMALEEIVVTAQKRAENLQDVPVSILAYNTEKLEKLHITDFFDYAKFLPSVSYQTYGPGASMVYMRGVASGGDGNHSGSLPSVGIYLDEQPITTIQGALDIHIYDIARVEALSGPQGTLYGASSQAGTLRIITNKPDPSKFSAAYDFEVNNVAHGDFGYTGEGYVNAPINEHAAVRLVGWYERDAGFIDNVHKLRTYPTSGAVDDNAAQVKNNYNDVETYGGRAALKVDLNDSWTITPQIMGQEQRSHGVYAYDSTVGDLQVAHIHPEFAKDRWFQAGLTVEGKIGNFDLVYAGTYLKRDIDSAADYADYAYFYDVLYGYGAYFYDDNGTLVNPSQYIQGRDRFTKESHELRISSPSDEKLRFVGGLFYQRQTHNIQQRYMVDNIGTDISVPGWPDTIWLTKQERIDRDYAAFGELTYDVTDKLTVTGGLRIFRYNNSLAGFFGYSDNVSSKTGVAKCIGGVDGPVLVAGGPCTNLYDENISTVDHVYPRSAKKTDFTYKLNASYHINDDAMVYATWSRGFRPGGINRRGSLPPYLPDFLTNYEVGWKTTLADGRVRFNGDFYVQDWKGVQFAVLGQNGLTEITNATKARIKGVEGDVTIAVSEGFTLNGNAAYTSGKLVENYCGTVLPDGTPITDCARPEAPNGTRLPVTPKFKTSWTARYEFPMGEMNGALQGSLAYQTMAYSDLRVKVRRIIGNQAGYALADFSFEVSEDNWKITAYVQNAFDKRASLTRYTECAEEVCGGEVYLVPARPRTFGIKFGQKF
ncbi:TonB-dependent receptor [Kordiimonas marina]|uniref:TonB-dependent receptor n=1 Tax=Kordiimonas marina TaxID=2872312 RepID=UPI001FF5881C|nr:TonB-dependent receptor [Kordiimonas marina]MCJ9430641.1 TonB-dependent receptor [Kordiimonas marina]